MKNEIPMELQFKEAYADLEKADKIIKKRYRYFCGIVSKEKKDEIGCGDLFFESPDYQNDDLYYELRKLKWINSGYEACYHWGVSKGKIKIEYVEGDIYVRELKSK
jgi:hypothetical protein